MAPKAGNRGARKNQRRNLLLQVSSAVVWLGVALVSTGIVSTLAVVAGGCSAIVATSTAAQMRKPKRGPLPAKPRKQSQRRPQAQKMTATSKGMRPAEPTQTPRAAMPAKPRLRKQVCSAACRMSKKPASTCDCSCGGRSHGMYANGGKRPAAQPAPARKAPARQPAVAKPKQAPTAVQPKKTEPPLRSIHEQRGWKSLQSGSKAAMEGHAAASPKCARGTATAKTVRDRRTDPPTVTQQLVCDTCGSRIR
jgi:hypothetical protein